MVRISDKEQQAVRKSMLTDLGLIKPEESRKAAARESKRLKANNDASEDAGMKWAEKAMNLSSEVNSLKVELNSMRAQRNRANKETFNLRKKLAAITKDAK